MSYVALTPPDLIAAAGLFLLSGFASIVLRLDIERSLTIAALRMVLQLAAMGFVLRFVFEQTSAAWTLALAAVMILAAGWETLTRPGSRLFGWRTYALSTGTLFVTGVCATLYATLVVIGPEPPFAPRFVLPILGMVLGNALTGVSLVLTTLSESAERERASIEARLALGQTRFEAMSGAMRTATRTGLLPILNAMAASGVVAVPGMMTGQILAGADPLEAAKYQIMIMLVLAGASGLAVTLSALGAVFLLTDSRHRLRLDGAPAPGKTRAAPADVTVAY